MFRVIPRLACPRRSCTTLGCTPAFRSCVAWVWRRSWRPQPICTGSSAGEELRDSFFEPVERGRHDVHRGLGEVEELEDGDVVDRLETEVEQHDDIVHAEVDAPVYLVPAHAVDIDAAPLPQVAGRHDVGMVAEAGPLLRREKRLNAVARRQAPGAVSLEERVDVGEAGAVHAGGLGRAIQRLGESLAEALFTHVQSGVQPVPVGAGPEDLLQLGAKDAAADKLHDEPPSGIYRGSRANRPASVAHSSLRQYPTGYRGERLYAVARRWPESITGACGRVGDEVVHPRHDQ